MSGFKASTTNPPQITTADLEVDSGTLSVDASNNRLGIGTTSPKTELTVEGTITVKERASAAGNNAAYGQLWVKSNAPCDLFFTDDTGQDVRLTNDGSLAAPPSAGAVAADDINTGDANVTIQGGSGHSLTLNATAATAQLKTTTSGQVDITSAADIDINATTGIAIDAADEIVVTTTSADGHISLVSAHTAGVAFHIDANAHADSEVQIDAGVLDIDVTGDAAIDSSAGSITIGAALADGQTLKLGKNGAVETIIAPHGTPGSEAYSVTNTAGTTDGAEGQGAILLEAVAGGIGLHGADDKDIWVEAGQVVITANHNTADAIKLHADAGANQTIKIVNDAGTDDGAEAEGAILIEATTGGIGLHGADDKRIWAEAGEVIVTANNNGAAAIKLHADAGANQTIQLLNDAGTASTAIDIEATAGGFSIDGVQASNITVASAGDADDLTISVTGANDASLILASAGTGADAITLNASAGSIDIDSADNITIDASDDIALTTGTADGLITLHSAHTAGQAILIDANAAAGSILDIDAGILTVDLQGAGTITAGGLLKTDATGVEIENGSGVSAPALLIDNDAVAQKALAIDAANTTADVISVSADALTTKAMLSLSSNSTDNSARSLTKIANKNSAAVGATVLAITNAAVASTAGQTVLIETSVASETNPLLNLKNTNADANGPILRLTQDGGSAGAASDIAGKIQFFADDADQNNQEYASINATVAAATAGSEQGKLEIGVACTDDGGVDTVLTLEGGSDGASSTTTVAGDLLLKHDGAQIKFGADGDITLTHNADKGLILEQPTDATTEPIFEIKAVGDLASGGGIQFTLDNDAGEGDGDVIGYFSFKADDDGNNPTEFAKLSVLSSDVTNNDEGGQFKFEVMANDGGSSNNHGLVEAFNIVGGLAANAEVVVNDSGVDLNFRVEGDSETHLLFVDAVNERVSIGDSDDTPAATLEVTNHASAGATGVPLMQLNSNDTDEIALDINAANIDAVVLDITANAVTTAKVINISATGLTTGKMISLNGDSDALNGAKLLDVYTDSTSTDDYVMVSIKKDSTEGSDTNEIIGLDIDFDTTDGTKSKAFRIVSDQTDGDVMQLKANGLTHGDLLSLTSDASDTNARALIKVKQKNANGTGVSLIELDQASTGDFITGAYSSGAGFGLKMKDSGSQNVSTSGTVTTLTDFIPANAIPIALSVRVLSNITHGSSNAHITRVGGETIGDNFFMGDNGSGGGNLNAGILEQANDIVTVSVNAGDGLFGGADANMSSPNPDGMLERNLTLTHAQTPTGGAVRVVMWYWQITPPTS